MNLLESTNKRPAFRRLSEVPAGGRAVVRKVEGSRGLSSRLAALGVVVGSAIEVLQNPREGPMLVRARNTRVALGRNEAKNVLIENAEQ